MVVFGQYVNIKNNILGEAWLPVPYLNLVLILYYINVIGIIM